MKFTEKPKRRFLYRLLIFNILLVLLVTTIPQMVSLYYTGSMLDEEIDNLNMQTVKQVKRIVDDEILYEAISFTNKNFSPILGNEVLTYPLENNIRNNAMAKVGLQRRIAEIMNYMPRVSNIYLYYTKSNILAYRYQVRILDDGKGMALPGWMDAFMKSDKKSDWVFGIDPADNRHVISYVSTIPVLALEDNIQLIMSVSIVLDEMSEMLRNYKPEQNGYLLILDDNGRIIASNQTEFSEMEHSELESMLRQFNAQDRSIEGKMNIRLHHTQNVLSYVKSGHNDWIFAAVVPVSAYYKKISDLRMMTLLLVGCFLLINLAAAYFLARKAQKPIVSEIEELEEKLENNKPIIRHNFVLSLLTGSYQFEKNYKAQADMFRFFTEGHLFFCFKLDLQDKGISDHKGSIVLPYKILERMEEAKEHYEIWAVKDERNHISGILKFCDHTKENSVLNNLMGILNSIVGNNFTMGIGNTYHDIETQICVSYREASDALEYFYIKPECTVIRYKELNIRDTTEGERYSLPIDDIERFMRASEEKHILSLLEKMIETISMGRFSVDYARSILAELVSVIRKAMKDMGMNTTEVFGCDIREKYKTITNVLEYKSWMEEIIHTAVDEINKRRQNINLELGEKIRNYITQHLDKDLSLETLAKYIGVTPTYLSKVFKQSIGTTFTDYVTDMKLRYAVILLKEKKYTVQDISIKLGYYSTHHFIRLFKEKYGQTPKQYQKQQTEE